MAHSLNEEAAGQPVDDMDTAAAAFAQLDSNDEPVDEGQREEHNDDEPVTEEGGDLDLEDGETDESDGQDAATEAPASLNAEEKARYAQLPKEAQQFVAELETRRNGQVQTATTKAAEAQRTAEASAARADAQAQAKYAQQLKAFSDHLAPQRPDPMLAQTDPATYIALNAQYDAAKAQHDEFVQQVTALGEDASNSMSQAEIAERDRFLMTLPEVQNEATRGAFFEKAIDAAKTLGLDLSAIDVATGQEWKALNQVAGWREKADKYDAAMARQMQRVRQGQKSTVSKPGAAQPSSGQGQRLRDAKQKARETGDVRDAAAAIRALTG